MIELAYCLGSFEGLRFIVTIISFGGWVGTFNLDYYTVSALGHISYINTYTVKPLYSDTLYRNNLHVVIKNFGPNLDQL